MVIIVPENALLTRIGAFLCVAPSITRPYAHVPPCQVISGYKFDPGGAPTKAPPRFARGLRGWLDHTSHNERHMYAHNNYT